jgi:hypothetical protein
MNATERIRVSAVIVSYFTGPLLARAIASLKAQPDVGEIILVDNGNWEDAVAEAIAADAGGAPVEVITGQGNVGFAAACNLGARKARGEFLLFLNPDAVMPEYGLARLLADGKTLPRPWVMGAKIVDPGGSEQQGSRRAVLTPWRAFVEATKLYKLAPRHPYFRRFNLHGEPCPAETTATPVISGACFFVPRSDYFAIGGMDERYFLHVEDIDFCLRIAEAGGGVYFNPHVEVAHHKSSSRANPLRVEFRKTTSMLRYFRRHFSGSYPPPFLWLVALALWVVFALKAARRGVSRMLALVGLRARRGAAGARRARSISAKRASR